MNRICFFGWNFACVAIGLFCMIAVLIKMYQLQLESHKLFRTPLVFLFVFMILWVSTFVFKFTLMNDEDKFIDAFRKWAACTFANFDGENDHHSYWNVCGKHVKTRVGLDSLYGFAIVIHSQVCDRCCCCC